MITTMPKEMRSRGAVEPGQKIKLLRNTLHLSQADISQIMEVERATVGAYEIRPNATPSTDKIRLLVDKLVQEYGADRTRLLAWMYDGADTPPDLRSLSMIPAPVKLYRGGAIATLTDQSETPPIALPANCVAVRPEGIERAGYGATVYCHITPDVPPGAFAVCLEGATITMGVSEVDGAHLRLRSYGTGELLASKPNGYALAVVKPLAAGRFEVEFDGAPLPA